MNGGWRKNRPITIDEAILNSNVHVYHSLTHMNIARILKDIQLSTLFCYFAIRLITAAESRRDDVKSFAVGNRIFFNVTKLY